MGAPQDIELDEETKKRLKKTGMDALRERLGGENITSFTRDDILKRFESGENIQEINKEIEAAKEGLDPKFKVRKLQEAQRTLLSDRARSTTLTGGKASRLREAPANRNRIKR